MTIILDNGDKIPARDMSLSVWRRLMAELMTTNPNASSMWDLMGCVRGPDTPSENPSMSPDDFNKAYKERRKRKYQTVEVIRSVLFYGAVGEGARSHEDTKVIVRPAKQRDHYDVHVLRAARALGLSVEEEGK